VKITLQKYEQLVTHILEHKPVTTP